MKKLIITSVLAIAALVGVQVDAKADKKEAHTMTKMERKAAHKKARLVARHEVNMRSKENFISDFGHVAEVTWRKGSQFDEAIFKKDGKVLTAYYDYDSKLVGTTSDRSFKDLPAHAQKEIKDRYEGYVPGAVLLFHDNKANERKVLFYGSKFEEPNHFFVTVSKEGKETVLMVSMDGQVSYLKQIS